MTVSFKLWGLCNFWKRWSLIFGTVRCTYVVNYVMQVASSVSYARNIPSEGATVVYPISATS